VYTACARKPNPNPNPNPNPKQLKFAEMEYLEVLGACAAHVWATPWTMHNLVKAIKEAALKKEAELRWQGSPGRLAGVRGTEDEGGGSDHADEMS